MIRASVLADRVAAQTGVDASHRCQMLIRDAFNLTEMAQCPQPAKVEVASTCACGHDDVDRLCVEHSLKAGDGSYCNDCATGVPSHACPITVHDRRNIR